MIWFGSNICSEESIAIKLAGFNWRLNSVDLEGAPSINNIYDKLK